MRDLVERHIERTHSVHARLLLADWETTVAQTWKVIPVARLELQRLAEEAEPTQGAAD